MMLMTLIYVSSATRSFSRADIKDILQHSRQANAEKDITGLLLFKDGNFMQVLEGDAATVDELQEKITQDPRHHDIITLLRKPIAQRSFADWKMGFKDLNDLTSAEKAGHSDYLDRPLNDTTYVTQPSHAFMLLNTFKQLIR